MFLLSYPPPSLLDITFLTQTCSFLRLFSTFNFTNRMPLSHLLFSPCICFPWNLPLINKTWASSHLYKCGFKLSVAKSKRRAWSAILSQTVYPLPTYLSDSSYRDTSEVSLESHKFSGHGRQASSDCPEGRFVLVRVLWTDGLHTHLPKSKMAFVFHVAWFLDYKKTMQTIDFFFFSKISRKSNQERHYAIHDLLMSHVRLI